VSFLCSDCSFFFHDSATTYIYTLSYTTLFRSIVHRRNDRYDILLLFRGRLPKHRICIFLCLLQLQKLLDHLHVIPSPKSSNTTRSEEHTSELQSRENLVCRLLLEKKNTTTRY